MNILSKIFFRPPFIGLLGFVIVLLVQALGHTVMILMENIFGEAYVYQSATVLGAAGAGNADDDAFLRHDSSFRAVVRERSGEHGRVTSNL